MKNILPDWLCPSRLTCHLSSSAEIGFSKHGVSVTLSGLLNARRATHFIHKIHISLEGMEDRQIHTLDWFAHDKPDLVTSADKSPAKFILYARTAYPFHIVFVDNFCFAQMKPFIKDLTLSWQTSPCYRRDTAQLPQEFISSAAAMVAISGIQRMCYWRPQVYRLVCVITSGEKNTTREICRSFRLTADDVKKLTGNTTRIINDVCCNQSGAYAAISVELK